MKVEFVAAHRDEWASLPDTCWAVTGKVEFVVGHWDESASPNTRWAAAVVARRG